MLAQKNKLRKKYLQRKRKRNSAFLLLGTLLGSLFFGGCSSFRLAPAEINERMGFFDHLADLEPANRSRQTKLLELGDVEHWDGVYGLSWPLKNVSVTSGFGKRGRRIHEGVDLRAPVGTPVLAAQSGRVFYVGSRLRGYGKLVILRHENGIQTVYAHNSRLLVKKGQSVKKGQRIALSGQTGRAFGPHVHFEVRKKSKPIDPLDLLPTEKPRTLAAN